MCTDATSGGNGGGPRGEIIYPRGVFQRSRSRLVNFWPTRRVPPPVPVPLPAHPFGPRRSPLFRERKARQRRVSGKQLHNFRGKPFRFGIRVASAIRGGERRRGFISFASRVTGRRRTSPSSRSRFALSNRTKLFKLLLELNYAA